MGKTKMNKSERIRQLDRAGYTVKQIAAKIGCTPSYVHQIRWLDKKSTIKFVKTGITGINKTAPSPTAAPAPIFTSITPAPKRPRGRPRKVTRKVQNTFTPPVVQVGEATLEYHPARLSLRQRIKALFTGRI